VLRIVKKCDFFFYFLYNDILMVLQGGKMKKSGVFLIIFMFVSFFILHSQWYSNSNILPIVKKTAGNINFEVNSLKKDAVFYIHYKTKGNEGYQIRKMKTDNNGRIYYKLSTKNLYGKKLEYYITQTGTSKTNSMTPVFTVTNFTNEAYPVIYFMAAASGDMTAKKNREKIVKLAMNISTTSRLSDNAQYPGKKFTANGNFRVYRNIYKDKYQFDFDSNFSYMNEPMDSESKINLSSMMVRYKRGIHKIEAGDVSISNTEFTTSYLSRRGFNYVLDHKHFYFSTFFTNSQQKKGFDGFGIPSSDANIFGTVIGYKRGYDFEIKGLFMTGTDNLDSKTVSYTGDQFREGSMLSVWSSLNLFKNHLTLKGEYAKSNFGKGSDEENIEMESDTAYNTSINFNYKILSGNVGYKKIGSHFNSIANLFLQNDREGLNSGITMTIKSFSLNVSYSDQKTYMESTVQPMLNTKNLTTTLSWMLGTHVRLGADYGNNNLDYDQSTGLQSGGTDMTTVRYGSSLGFIAGSNGINFRLGKTESKTYSSNLSGSVSINLRLGNFFSFNPSVNYQERKNYSDNSVSKNYSAYVSSEIYFVPQILSVSFTGSYSKSEGSSYDSTNISAGGNLNFNMSKIFKNVIQPSLSIKTKYLSNDYSGTKTDSFSIYLQADLSF